MTLLGGRGTAYACLPYEIQIFHLFLLEIFVQQLMWFAKQETKAAEQKTDNWKFSKWWKVLYWIHYV